MGSSHLPPAAGPPQDRDSASVGSSRSKIKSQQAPASDEAPTIISGGSPMPLQLSPLGAHPLELGRKLEGERLGHFELNEFIGGGGMGAVFKAVDTMLNRTVAVKVLSTEQARDPETQRRFKNEAQSAARLDHANIARVYYVGEDRGVHYIVFEYIKGTNLRDVVDRRGPLSMGDVIRITLQVVEALSHASERDVVHRDIKPSNVLITPDGKAKLVDMGLARLHQVEHSNDDLTASGVTLGTFDYISPEQARDPRTADVRSDLYSLGCTMYFMLTGRPPFPEGTVLQKLLMHQGDVPPNPADIRSDVPSEMSRVVRKLLAKSPAQRYQTPRSLAADLLMLADQLRIGLGDMDSVSRYVLRDASLADPFQRTESAWRRHLPWVASVLLLLGAVAWLDRNWAPEISSTKLPPLNPMSAQPIVPPTPSDTPKPPVDDPSSTSDSALPSPATQDPDPTEDPIGVPDEPSAPQAEPTELPPAVVRTTEPAIDPEARIAPENRDSAPTPSDEARLAAGLRTEGLSEGLAIAEPMSETLTYSVNDDVAEMSAALAVAARRIDDPVAVVRPIKSADKLLIVSPNASAPAYSSLASAVAAAPSGAVIELQFTGELVERPLLLANHSLTIRAGEGFVPRLVFRPTSSDVDPNEYPRSMFSLTGGQLTLINLKLDLEVPRSVPAERWTLVTLRGVENVRLSRCCLTIRNASESQNAYHPNVAFFRTASRSDAEAMAMDDDPTQILTANLRLSDCVVRGEADFYRAASNLVADVQWDNGLLVTSGRAFELAPSELGSERRGSLRADLSHLTILNRSGLLSVAAATLVSPLPDVEINCRDSILIGASGPPLIQHESVRDAEEAKRAFVWRGNRNFYERYDVFWALGGVPFSIQDDVLRRVGWQNYWEVNDIGEEIVPGQLAVRFQPLPTADAPLNSQTPSDYSLDMNEGNPALGAASDGYDAGMRRDALADMVQAATPKADRTNSAGQVLPASAEEPSISPEPNEEDPLE